MRGLSNIVVALFVGCGVIAVLPGPAAGAADSSAPAAFSLPASAAAAADPFPQAWGDNRNGALGDGTTTARRSPVAVTLPDGSVPALVSGGRDYIAAESHTIAAGASGVLYAWGRNQYGQLGNGTTTQSLTPVVVTLPSGVTPKAIAAGGQHNLMIGSNDSLYAWGNNANGQLGNASTTSATTPVPIALPGGAEPVAVAAGYRHSLALDDDGVLYSWGYNATGELGTGTTTQRTSPVAVPLPAGITVAAISAGLANTSVLTTSGAVYVWGDNQFGQLGDGTTVTRTSPGTALSIPGAPRLKAVTVGYGHVLVETSSGEVYSSGFNNFGQLGTGSTANSSSFVQIALPSGVVAQKVVAGSTASFAITSAGKIYGWGDNRFGQLSDGTTTAAPTPKLLTRTTRTVELSAGAYHVIEIASSELTIPQTISFTSTAPTAAKVGGSNYSVVATGGGSGNAISFSVDPSTTNNACTLTGTTVSFAHAGTCVLAANQAGNSDYDPAVKATQSFPVGKAAQTIEFTSEAPTGAKVSAAGYSVAARGGDSGNPVALSIDPTTTNGACTITGATVSLVHAGNCVLAANQAGTPTMTPL